MAARHADDLELCRQLPGMCYGKVCDACEGRCPICDSRANPTKPVKICDSCAGSERFRVMESLDYAQLVQQQKEISQQQRNLATRNEGNTDAALDTSALTLAQQQQQHQSQHQRTMPCIICSGKSGGVHQAFYCRACVLLERDRDGCPKVKGRSRRQQMSARQQKKSTDFKSAAASGGLFAN